jgi:hypothetical protein
MGLADEIHSNLDALYQEMLEVNAQDAFAVTIAATVRSVIDKAPPSLRIAGSAEAPAEAAAATPTASVDDVGADDGPMVVRRAAIDAPAAGQPVADGTQPSLDAASTKKTAA